MATDIENRDEPRRIAAKRTSLMRAIIARAKGSPKIGDVGLQEFLTLSETIIEQIAILEERTDILSGESVRVRDALRDLISEVKKVPGAEGAKEKLQELYNGLYLDPEPFTVLPDPKST